MDLRGKDFLLKIGEGTAVEIIIKRTSSLDFSKRQALPNIHHVISRKYTLIADYDKKMVDKENAAINEIAHELQYDWIYMNVPTVCWKNVKKKLQELFKLVKKLEKTYPTKRGKTWFTEMEKLKLELDNGFDIRSFHDVSITEMTEKYGIDVGEEEEKLYVDNCVPEENGKCRRKAYVTGVDPAWVKQAKKRQAGER